MLNKIRNCRTRLRKNVYRWYSSLQSLLLWKKIKSSIRKNEGFIGKRGQVLGTPSDHHRIVLGYQNHIEDGLNLWFSAKSLNISGTLTTGDFLFVGFGSYFGVYSDIFIGNNVSIAAQAYIVSGTHNYSRRDIPIQQQGLTGGPIVIGNDVWIGCKVVILPNVSIGDGAIIAAGSLVNKNVPPFEIWGGIPARKIRDRP